MKIKIFKENTKKFDFIYSKKLNVIVIALYFFTIQIMLSKKSVDIKAYREKVIAQFNKTCKVCGKPLRVNSMFQIVYYHKECRKYRHKKNVIQQAV